MDTFFTSKASAVFLVFSLDCDILFSVQVVRYITWDYFKNWNYKYVIMEGKLWKGSYQGSLQVIMKWRKKLDQGSLQVTIKQEKRLNQGSLQVHVLIKQEKYSLLVKFTSNYKKGKNAFSGLFTSGYNYKIVIMKYERNLQQGSLHVHVIKKQEKNFTREVKSFHCSLYLS